MWFCMDCLCQASKIIRNISDIQKRQENTEHELMKANARINQMEAEIKENRQILETEATSNKKALGELQSVVSALEIAMHDVQEEVTNTRDETPKWSDIVERAVECKYEKTTVELNEVEKSIEEMKKKTLEIKDKEDRRNNIILFKVPECQPGSYEEVMKHDEEFCLKLCDDILEIEITREDIKRMFRIGKRGPEPRPLLVHLSSGSLKNRVMESSFKLRNAENFKQVTISHDMTKQEREQCKQLVTEARDLESREQSGEYIYRVRGAPGDMKIVKIKKRT